MRRYFQRSVLISVLGIVWGISLPAFADPGSELLPSLQRIQSRHRLIVAMPAKDSPPFFMTDGQGRTYGLDYDIAKDISSRLGVTLVIDRSAPSYDATVEQVVHHKADLAMGHLTATLKRSMQVLFTSPYLTVKHVLLVNRVAGAKLKLGESGDPAARIADESFPLGVVEGSSFVAVAESEFPHARLKTFKSEPQLFEAVDKGEVIVALVDEVAARNWEESNPKFSIAVQTVIRGDRSAHIAMAVNWREQPFLSWLNFYLETIRSEGRLARWVHEYLEEQEWRRVAR